MPDAQNKVIGAEGDLQSIARRRDARGGAIGVSRLPAGQRTAYVDFAGHQFLENQAPPDRRAAGAISQDRGAAGE